MAIKPRAKAVRSNKHRVSLFTLHRSQHANFPPRCRISKRPRFFQVSHPYVSIRNFQTKVEAETQSVSESVSPHGRGFIAKSVPFQRETVLDDGAMSAWAIGVKFTSTVNASGRLFVSGSDTREAGREIYARSPCSSRSVIISCLAGQTTARAHRPCLKRPNCLGSYLLGKHLPHGRGLQTPFPVPLHRRRPFFLVRRTGLSVALYFNREPYG